MADKWRFDPYKDYTDDYSDEPRSNFQRFKNKKKKSNSKQRELDFEKNIRRNKKRFN